MEYQLEFVHAISIRNLNRKSWINRSKLVICCFWQLVIFKCFYCINQSLVGKSKMGFMLIITYHAWGMDPSVYSNAWFYWKRFEQCSGGALQAHVLLPGQDSSLKQGSSDETCPIRPSRDSNAWPAHYLMFYSLTSTSRILLFAAGTLCSNVSFDQSFAPEGEPKCHSQTNNVWISQFFPRF